MAASHDPRQNHLLAALPADDLAGLAAMLELVPMRLGETLHAPGVPLQQAYFPTTSVVSLHHVTAAGESAQAASVGHEGIVGIALYMGGQSTTGSALVQSSGHGYRLNCHALARAFDAGGALQRSLLRYAQALITQVAQTAACYRNHRIEQQLSRWLLNSSDRAPGTDLVMTQELVAGMLGVRRESITEAAGDLQRAGHIQCRRGHIRVVDVAGLERHSCECYGVVKAELQRLLALPAAGMRA